MIIDVWNDYTAAYSDVEKEAETLYLLYQTVAQLPGTERTLETIASYLDYIIKIEFPSLSEGIVPPEGREYVNRLRSQIYGYNPSTNRENLLYSKSLDLYSNAITLRIDRINSATLGLASEIWWVLIIITIITFILLWFIPCEGLYLYIFCVITSIYIASGLFLIIALEYPFTGAASLSSEPYQIALYNIRFPQIIL
jgi:hypothetical protein